ncbi:MAG: hypothetical protein ACFE9M_11990 [Promethearchaeota archaeon]
MSGENYDDFGVSFNSLLQKIEVVKRKRNDLNKKIKEYISSFQMIETELIDSFLAAKETYDKRWKYCIKKRKMLRKKKIDYEYLLNNLIEERKILQNPRSNSKDLELIESTKNSINQIDDKIQNLERKIKFELLNINEENEIIEEINTLEKKKQELKIKLQSSELYKNQRKIEIIDIKLKTIVEQLNKWFFKRRNSCKEIFDLFQKVYKLNTNKKKMEKQLSENKRAAERYFLQFSRALNYENEISKKLHYINKLKQKEIPWFGLSIKNKELFKKFKQEKLAVALEKQKSGKKLDFYEYRLILDRSEK